MVRKEFFNVCSEEKGLLVPSGEKNFGAQGPVRSQGVLRGVELTY